MGREKEKWKLTPDFERYCKEHRYFLEVFQRVYPEKKLESRIFWKLGKLKERYPNIQKIIEDEKNQK